MREKKRHLWLKKYRMQKKAEKSEKINKVLVFCL